MTDLDRRHALRQPSLAALDPRLEAGGVDGDGHGTCRGCHAAEELALDGDVGI